MLCRFAGLGLASGLRPCSHSLATANQPLSYRLGWVSRQNSEKPSNIMYKVTKDWRRELRYPGHM